MVFNKSYYELHVTLETDDGVIHAGWKNSAISGDPDLGDGVRFYRTAHCKYEFAARAKILDAKLRLWPHALRYKIEHVIYDDRRPE